MRHAVLLGIGLLLIVATCCAQTFAPGPSTRLADIRDVPTFWIADSVKAQLAADWTDSLGQRERAYCLTYTVNRPLTNWNGPEDVFWIVGAVLAPMSAQTPTSVSFNCPKGTVALHTHPPQTRLFTTDGVLYLPEGQEARQCWPSRTDRAALMLQHQPLGMVQCDRHALVPYWNPVWLFLRPPLPKTPDPPPPTRADGTAVPRFAPMVHSHP